MSSSTENLRPIERVVLRMVGEDLPVAEIAARVGRGPRAVQRMLQMIEYKQRWGSGVPRLTRGGQRPLERVILRMRSQGCGYGEIGNRLRRSGAQVRRIEGYAQLRPGG